MKKKDPIENRTYTTSEIAAIIGKTIHKTISYINRGYIKPSIQDASGHGSKRLWSYLDVVRMCLIERLEDLGVSVAKLRKVSQSATDKRLAEHMRLIIHEGRTEALVEWVQHTIEEEPFVAASIPAEEIRFDISPAKIVVSIFHLRQWAKERIKKAKIE